MSAAAAQTIGKARLAEMLGWTRPKLDRRLTSDASFPVVSRGDQSGGWAFDPAAVSAYLGADPVVTPGPAKSVTRHSAPRLPAAPPPPAVQVDAAQLRDAVKPPPVEVPQQAGRRSAHHSGEATAKQRKDAADAALRENKLRIENLELVDKGELRQVLADVFASLGNDLDALADDIAKLLGLPDEVSRIRDMIDKARARMVSRAAPLLTDE